VFNWFDNTYRKILDHMADGVYFVGPDQRILYWSRGAGAMSGFTSEEMTGSSLNDRRIHYEDGKGNPLQPFEYPAALCLQEKRTVSKHFFLKTKDSRLIPVEETASPLLDRGKVKGVITVIKDITSCIESTEFRLRSERKERLIPICGWCKKIRSDENYWEQIETYLTDEGFGVFTHGMCPSCADKIFEKKVYLESYQQICKSISASISLEEVLQLIVRNVVKVMNVKASLVRLLNRETKQLELAAYYGVSERYANKGPVAYDASIDDALAGQPASVYDITEHTDSKYYREALEEGIRSILSIPLRFEKEVIGVLRMYTTEPVKYTEEDMKFITAIAEQAATGIVNARRFEKAVSREKEYLRVFEEVTKVTGSSLNLNEVLNLIVRKIPQVMDLKGCSLRLVNKENKQLELAAYFGLSEKYANKGPVEYDENLEDALASQSVTIFDIEENRDSKYYQEAVQEGLRSIVSIPMRFHSEVVGRLRLYTSKPVQYTEEDMRFLEAIAEQTALAIVNAKHFETEITREREYLRVFEEVTKTVSSSLNLNEVLNLIVRKIPEVMRLKACSVRLVEKEKKQLELAAYYGLSERYANKGPVSYDKSIDDALAGKEVSEYDVMDHKDSRYYNEAIAEGIRNILSVPMRYQNEIVGVLRLYSGKPVKYTDADFSFMMTIAEQTAIAIINAKHFEREISKEKEYLKVFQEVTRTVSSTLHVREVLEMIVKKIPQVMGLKAATIRLLDHSGKKLRLVASSGLSEKYLNRGPVDTEENVIEALNEKPVAIYDVTTDPKIKYQKEAAEEGIKSILTLPIIARGKVLGILRLLTGEQRNFSQQEIDFSASLAEQCGIAIENATMYEKTKKEYDDMMQSVGRAFFEKE